MDSLESRRFLSGSSSTVFVTGTGTPGTGTVLLTSLADPARVYLGAGNGKAVKAVQLGGIKVSHTGTLFVTGTGKDDTIDLTISRGKLAFNPYYAIVPSAPNSGTASQLVVGPRTGNTIKRVVVAGLGGDDKITIHSDVDVAVRGGTGDDTITVSAPTHELSGGSGADLIYQSVRVPAASGDDSPFTVIRDAEGNAVADQDEIYTILDG